VPSDLPDMIALLLHLVKFLAVVSMWAAIRSWPTCRAGLLWPKNEHRLLDQRQPQGLG